MANPFFRIEMLPAKQGDALWIEYGTPENIRRILIDGGPIGAYDTLDAKLKQLPEGDKGVELVVISHVDLDHIEGIIRIFAAQHDKWPFVPKDIWFNGWKHLVESQVLGGREGDFLSALINRRAPDKWNKAFESEAVIVEPDKQLPVKTLKDGMKLTLLSPTPRKLKDMADKWTQDVEKYQLEPGDLEAAWEQLVEMKKYRVVKGVLGGTDDTSKKLISQLKTDDSSANGTSIAFLAEFDDKSCLFLADAHSDVICDSLKKLIPAREERIKVDAVKLSHHGSRYNISKELMSLIDAKHFLISTDSSKKQKHPNKEAINAVIHWSVNEPILWFNYKTKQTLPWAKVPAKSKKEFKSHYPSSNQDGIIVEL